MNAGRRHTDNMWWWGVPLMTEMNGGAVLPGEHHSVDSRTPFLFRIADSPLQLALSAEARA
jgi:hypothetical protein